MTATAVPAALRFDRCQWDRTPFAVSAQTKIDFSDYARMNTRVHHQQSQQLVPPWANSDRAVRAVLVAYVELRAGLKVPQVGDERQRLAQAQARLIARRGALVARLTRLQQEARRSNPARRRRLEILVQALDGELKMNQAGPGRVLQVLRLSWRLRMDSVAVAAELNMSPPQVRQTLFRLRRCGDRIFGK